MEIAYKEAVKAFKEDEVPIGCVIIKDGEVIAKAHNKKVKKNFKIVNYFFKKFDIYYVICLVITLKNICNLAYSYKS